MGGGGCGCAAADAPASAADTAAAALVLVLLGVPIFPRPRHLRKLKLYITHRQVLGTNTVNTTRIKRTQGLQDLLLLLFLRWCSDKKNIHVPVLNDASKIEYCRYQGRASLPPISRKRSRVREKRSL